MYNWSDYRSLNYCTFDDRLCIDRLNCFTCDLLRTELNRDRKDMVDSEIYISMKDIMP